MDSFRIYPFTVTRVIGILIGLLLLTVGCSKEDPSDNSGQISSATEYDINSPEFKACLNACPSQDELNEVMLKLFSETDFSKGMPILGETTTSISPDGFLFLPSDASAIDASSVYEGMSVKYSRDIWKLQPDGVTWSAWTSFSLLYPWPVSAAGTVLHLSKHNKEGFFHQVLCDHNGSIKDISLMSSQEISINHINLDSEEDFAGSHRITFAPNTSKHPKIWVIFMRGGFSTEPYVDLTIIRFLQLPADPNFKFDIERYKQNSPLFYYDFWLRALDYYPSNDL